MKKKSMVAVLAAAALTAVLISGCGERTDGNVAVEESEVWTGCVEGCACTNCICCGTTQQSAPVEASAESEPESTLVQQPESTDISAQEQPDTQETQAETGEGKETPEKISELSEGELQARREQQANFAEARETLYGLADSQDKTTKINQMDRQILANNAYDFSQKNIVFIGDSITEGITSAVDDNGNFVSYVTYVNSYLHFNRVLNHGKGGRMFADYADAELSLALNFSNVTNNSSDIIVVFAGVNDFLSAPENKRFGNIDDTVSTAGYCGAVRYFMRQLKETYGDKEIFFVTMYNISKTAPCTYSDYDGQPTLGDYMEVQRRLAGEYGFHIIELYDIGFMDCSAQESSDYYLRDGLHPKDNGNIVLGEHIAAELSLYFSQKESN